MCVCVCVRTELIVIVIMRGGGRGGWFEVLCICLEYKYIQDQFYQPHQAHYLSTESSLSQIHN